MQVWSDVRRKVVVLIVVVALAVSGGVVIWEYESGQGPSCSGYPPGGNCPGSYSYTFTVDVNYPGQWRVTWWGYHSVGADFGQVGNYTGGTFVGTGNSSKDAELSGPNNNGLALCARAQKLDSSTSTLTLNVLYRSNQTSLPLGYATLCGGVAP